MTFSILLSYPFTAFAAQDPYAAQGTAREAGRTRSLRQIRSLADNLATTARTAVELNTVAELYKRLGDSKACGFYERAIAADPEEPAYELSYGDYLRLYRGAGQQPLFQDAEKHLSMARSKLVSRQERPTAWDESTADQLQRSLTALYERDGFQLARRHWEADAGSEPVRLPWLFFSSAGRWARDSSDLDRASDVRDRTSETAFISSRFRLNRPLTDDELRGLVRSMTAVEGAGRFRIRYRSMPVIDVFASGRRSTDVQLTNFSRPGDFSDLELADFGVAVEKPLAISCNTDVLVHLAARRVNRKGLVESLPADYERIDQYEVAGAFARYLGPDRLNVQYAYTRMNISPDRQTLQTRNRELRAGSIRYQIFRPLPLLGRDLETGLGRRFETRGIDIFAGYQDDTERFPDTPVGVSVVRKDYFVGAAVRGLGRFDVTLQPTLFESKVSNDPSQSNSQVRVQGNLLFRVLDEERVGGIPREKFLGLPVAFVHVVAPFHWDTYRNGIDAFRSRKIGAELWTKLLSGRDVGVSILAVAGYSHQRFPSLNTSLNVLHVGLSAGF